MNSWNATPISLRTSTQIRGISLAPRRMRWDFSGVPACVCPGDPGLSAFLLLLSAIAPAFERWAIPVAREHEARLRNPALLQELHAFVGQEAQHVAGHTRLNTAVFD